MDIPDLPPLDLLVRVGCSLVYETATSASLLLTLRPRTDPRQELAQEMLPSGAAPRPPTRPGRRAAAPTAPPAPGAPALHAPEPLLRFRQADQLCLAAIRP